MEYKSGPGPAQHSPSSYQQPGNAETYYHNEPAPQTAPQAADRMEPESSVSKEPEAEFDLDSIVGEEDEGRLERKISSALNRIKQIIKEKDEHGQDTSELSELYRQCGNVFASGDFLTAVHYLERIQVYIDKMPGVPDEIESDLDEDEDEFDTIDVETGDIFDEGLHESSFDEGVVIFENVPVEHVDHFELEDKPKLGDKEKAIHSLESAKSAITDADEDGYDTTTAKKLFRDARPLYESGEFKAVINTVREVEREILRIKGHSESEIKELLGETESEEVKFKISVEERQELNGMINKIWVKLKEAEEYGLNTAGYKDQLEHAKAKRTFKDARAMVEAVGTAIKEQLSKFHAVQHDKASNMFHYVRSEIISATKLGIDVDVHQGMLDRASSSIARSDYDDAIFSMEKCLEALKTAVAEATGQAQVSVSAGAGEQKVEPVWDPDDDEDEARAASVTAGQKQLTDKERLKILEDRFILGEISEASYQELKSKLLERLGNRPL